MKIVVSDCSPLRALAQLGLLPLLDAMFESVYVPPAVVSEASAVVVALPAIDFSALRCVRFATPRGVEEVARLRSSHLGAGESEAMVLAMEVHADGVLMDDGPARKAAAAMGLTTLGVLGLLVRAKRQGLVGAIAPLLDRLSREIDFRVSPALREQVLKSAGESS